ncbi:MAG: GNAT family N-acetyltransferase [Candidatus Eremiobacteraeota bacterium]|nr:GNAT family N-acetyltransferase [Candidatus Eremiobacteraeota bacterium]
MIDVRPGRREDRAFARDLGRRTIGSSLSPLRAAEPALVHASFERLLDVVFEQSHDFLIAEREGERIGYLLLMDSMPDEVSLGAQGFVAYMAVEENARRDGVARALLREAERLARQRGLPYISLMVTEANDAARNLYETAGYVTERRLLCKVL